jgi:hypothetical protein
MKVKVWNLLGLLFIMIFALSAANAVHAVGVTATITVGASPQGVAYDSGKGEIFVANSVSNTVSVISDASSISASPSPTASQSPSPTSGRIPEFSSAALFSIIAMIAVTTCIVALAAKKSRRPMCRPHSA